MEAPPNEGVLKFFIKKCSNTVEAFEAAMHVVENHLSGKEPWDEDLLVSARSSLCFDKTETERTPLKMSKTSMYSYYRNTQKGHVQ